MFVISKKIKILQFYERSTKKLTIFLLVILVFQHFLTIMIIEHNYLFESFENCGYES
jgi:hypothetical protein